jgi:AcrR family transcriptional regulator
MEPGDRRDQIVRVAAAHFAERGYDKASIVTIAANADVTRALVYHYFPDKAALLEAVLRSEAEDLQAALRPDPALSVPENIRAGVRAYLAHFSEASGRTINLHMHVDTQPVLAGQISKASHAVIAQSIVTLLALKDDALIHAAVAVWLEFVSSLSHSTAGMPNVDRESVVDLCVGVLQTIAGVRLADISHVSARELAEKECASEMENPQPTSRRSGTD